MKLLPGCGSKHVMSSKQLLGKAFISASSANAGKGQGKDFDEQFAIVTYVYLLIIVSNLKFICTVGVCTELSISVRQIGAEQETQKLRQKLFFLNQHSSLLLH